MDVVTRWKRLAAALSAAVALFAVSPATAVPSLQLDIAGGTYVGGSEETIFASTNSFALYAYGLAADIEDTSKSFYLSIALLPATSTGGSFGSFKVGSTVYDVTDDMVYGTPPLESYLAFDSGDLSKHSIFPTYFTEIAFTFDGAQSGVYNTQDDAGSGPQAGFGMYYKKFDIDLSGLNTGYGLHFDLYATALVEKCKKGACTSETDVDGSWFAPFSHDAAGMVTPVPEPQTYALLFAGLGFLAWRLHSRKATAA